MNRKILISSLFFCLILQNSRTNAQDFWENLNVPSTGGIYSLTTSPNGNIYYGVGDGVFYSEDSGNNWFFSGFPAIAVYALISNPQGDIFAGTGGVNDIYRLMNDENEWEAIHPNSGNVISFAVDIDNNIFAGSGEILRSQDNGMNWESVFEMTSSQEPYSFAILNPETIYLGTTDFIGGGGVYQSIDSGNTWQHIGLENHYVSSIALNSKGDLYAATYNSGTGVFVLHNGDSIWEHMYNDWLLMTAIVIDKNDNIYIASSTFNGGSGGVRVSYDNGQSWDLLTTGMGNANIDELYIGHNNHLYAIEDASIDSIYRSINPITSIKKAIPSENIELYNYPNPFTNNTIITWSTPIANTGHVLLAVYNIKGKVIKKFEIPSGQNNKQSVIFDASVLNQGIYFYSISNEKIQLTKKMIKLE